MRNNKIYYIVVIVFLTLSTYFIAESNNSIEGDKTYRCTVKVKFRKVKPGPDMEDIFYPIPRTNDYQHVSNLNSHDGQIFNNPGSIERYVRYTISADKQPEEGEWGEVVLEFDYVPTRTEYSTQEIDKIYEYDTSSDIYKRYTTKYDKFFDTENIMLKTISDNLWEKSSDVFDYAKKCSDYVNDNFTFKDNPGMWNSMDDIIKYNGGDCGNLSSIFITLLRIKKIPARHVITRGHAWAEFYLEKNGWIPVDPTFKTFGKVTDAYGLIRSNEIIYHLETTKKRKFRNESLVKNHVFFPSHQPYECDVEIIQKEIEN